MRCYYRAPYESKRSPTRPFDTWRGVVRAPVPRDAEPCRTLLLEWLRDLVEMHALLSRVSRGHHGVLWVLGVLKYSAGLYYSRQQAPQCGWLHDPVGLW